MDNNIKPKLIILILSVLVFTFGIVIGSWGYTNFLKDKLHKKNEITNSIDSETTNPDVVQNNNFNGINDSLKDSYNLLLLGHGGQGHSGGMLMDSIILVNISFKDKKISLISIPRDLYIQGHKINEEYSISPGNDGWNRVKYAIASVTGLSVSNYMAIDFSNFIKAIDLLGGVEINITKPYTDEYYPIKGLENEICGKSAQEIADLHTKYSGFELEKQFKCRYETIHFDVGKTKIDGSTALKYVRSRHGDGDFGRSERQFTILKGLIAFSDKKDLISTLLNLVKTDLLLNDVKSLISKIGNPLDYSIGTVHITDANVLVSSKSNIGAYILIPRAGKDNFSQVQDLVKNGEN